MNHCQIPGCPKPAPKYRRLCSMHRARVERHGSSEVVHVVHGRLGERLDAKIVRMRNGCWLWTGACTERGYARVRVDAARPWVSAARVVYELHVGAIGAGLELDHLCHTSSDCTSGIDCPHRRCVNPAHLEPVTHAENVRRRH